jgi:hypothetical protein
MQDNENMGVYLKNIIYFICLFAIISILCGCLKASVFIPIDEPIGIKIESKDEKPPVLVSTISCDGPKIWDSRPFFAF